MLTLSVRITGGPFMLSTPRTSCINHWSLPFCPVGDLPVKDVFMEHGFEVFRLCIALPKQVSNPPNVLHPMAPSRKMRRCHYEPYHMINDTCFLPGSENYGLTLLLSKAEINLHLASFNILLQSFKSCGDDQTQMDYSPCPSRLVYLMNRPG